MTSTTLRLPDGRIISISDDSTSIGRDATCTVTLESHSSLAGKHAVIRRVADRWMVEGQGEQQIQVDDGPPARMGWLKPDAVIRLSSSGPELVFCPSADAPPLTPTTTEPASNVPEEPPATAATPDETQSADDTATAASPILAIDVDALRKSPMVWLVGASVLILIGLFIGSLMSPRATEADATANTADGAKDDTPAATVAAPEDGLYLVVVKNPAQEQEFQLGTAFAISEHQLVTSAAIVVGTEQLRTTAPLTAVRSASGKKEWSVISSRVHPLYRRAVADAATARDEAEELRAKIEETDDIEQRNKIVEELVVAEDKRFEALERQVFFDVAVLQVAEWIPGSFDLAADGWKARAGSKTTLHGMPFDQEEVFADPDAPPAHSESDGKVFARQQHEADGKSFHRMLVRCSLDLSGQNWSGSPLLNAAGEVVGVYSRPTPPPLDPEGGPRINTHDFAEFLRIRDIAPGQ